MTDVYLTAGLTRNRVEFAPGQTVTLPASLAGKLVDRGRATLSHSSMKDADLRPAAPLRPLALPAPEGAE